MDKRWLYICALITATAALAAKGYGYYKQLKYKVSKAYLSEINAGIVELTIDLMIKNPTPVSLTVQSVKGNVYLNGKRVGCIKTKIYQTLSSNAVSTIHIPVILDAVAASGNILGNLIKGNDFENHTLLAKTEITVANIPVKVNFIYKLSELL